MKGILLDSTELVTKEDKRSVVKCTVLLEDWTLVSSWFDRDDFAKFALGYVAIRDFDTLLGDIEDRVVEVEVNTRGKIFRMSKPLFQVEKETK